MRLIGDYSLTCPFWVDFRPYEWRYRYWGRHLGHHRVYWHLGVIVVSWPRKD